jgi:hypothetical protein
VVVIIETLVATIEAKEETNLQMAGQLLDYSDELEAKDKQIDKLADKMAIAGICKLDHRNGCMLITNAKDIRRECSPCLKEWSKT